MYKHVADEGLHITVDPTTKELTSKPTEQLIKFLDENNSVPVKDLIEADVFVKVCDCIMEVKKLEKVAATKIGIAPEIILSAGIKIESILQDSV